MGNMQMKIGNAVLKSLIDLHESKGEVKLEDVGSIFESMASTLHSEETPPHSFLRDEISKLAAYIAEAKREIFAISPPATKDESAEATEGERSLTHAGLELDEVVKATEEATNVILDATDEVIKGAGSLSDKAAATKITEAANRIYDACTFQDITGQRIKKVSKTLEYVELKINRLVSLFSDSTNHLGRLTEWDEQEKNLADTRSDAVLMHGPSLSTEAPSQEDIDKLFAKLK